MDTDFRKVSSSALFFLFNLEKFLEETEGILAMAGKATVVEQNGVKMEDASTRKHRYAQVQGMVEIHIPEVPHLNPRLMENQRSCKY